LNPIISNELRNSVSSLISLALSEDIGAGDITTNATVPVEDNSFAEFISKADGLAAGLWVAEMVFSKLDQASEFIPLVAEGEIVKPGQKIAQIKGKTRAILTGERTALNFLQRISGVATQTALFVKALRDTKTKILDTRKTIPGFRLLDKYAVSAGGGTNHRIGLYDLVMIKDNHIKAAGSIGKAVNLVRISYGNKFKIEVEVTNFEELDEALKSKVDIIMLDNMSPDIIRNAVNIIGGRAKTEASGNVTIENISRVAETGVDFISTGSITHSVKALDISMKFC